MFKTINNTLVFTSRFKVNKLKTLVSFLQENKNNIQEVEFRIEQNFATIYVLKKILGKNIKITGLKKKDEVFFQYLNINTPNITKEVKEVSFNPFKSCEIFFQPSSTNRSQDKFWLESFFLAQKTLFFDAVNTIFVWFFATGFTFSLISYRQFAEYALEIESYPLVYIAFVKFICPIMSAFVMTSKSCTAITSGTKAMEINGEIKVLSLMNLPLNSTYLYPVFAACVITAPVLNMLAIISSIIGAFCSSVSMGSSFELFVSIYERIFSPYDIIISCMKSLIFGGWIGMVTCSAAQYPGRSFKAIIASVDICVTYSIIGFIIIQFVLEFLSMWL